VKKRLFFFRFLKTSKSFLDILKMSILQKWRPRKSKKCDFWIYSIMLSFLFSAKKNVTILFFAKNINLSEKVFRGKICCLYRGKWQHFFPKFPQNFHVIFVKSKPITKKILVIICWHVNIQIMQIGNNPQHPQQQISQPVHAVIVERLMRAVREHGDTREIVI
jgi:hypothetical protein